MSPTLIPVASRISAGITILPFSLTCTRACSSMCPSNHSVTPFYLSGKYYASPTKSRYSHQPPAPKGNLSPISVSNLMTGI